MGSGEVVSEKIHLRRITPQNQYFDNHCDLRDKDFEMHVAQTVQHSLEKKSFKISLLVSFSCEEIRFAEYLYDFIFEVENMLDFLVEVEHKKVFTKQIVGTLVGISYSTLRGLIYGKMSETNLNGFVLPVINPNDILKYKI
ncbi:hypothetical protein [Sphingobacterium sp. UDSM-2020]|uniref:hypothetical protein n=1 Tax=Sphingobacterium sp. UDSM-2020 TaxID=2795738 RepID=UPI0019362CD7|nr:hypothetical protein [Sphingobacterium sp. UDSM-2020]QQD13401.1 hypothetical protein JAZ75_22880 [Sphingobacterium sp. UDSM-2020]